MILYKYRSLENLNYVLDILLNYRLYCARYLDLSDPFEGLFSAIINIPPRERVKYKPFLLPETYTLTKSVDDLFISTQDRFRVCSLSSSLSEVRLWAQYAQGNRGIALAIDFSGIEDSVHEVRYSKELPRHGYTILTEPNPKELLTLKTFHWSYESEFRIIHEKQFFDIKNRVKAIYVGHRIEDIHLALLKKLASPGIPIIHTEIDPNKIEIRIKENTVKEPSQGSLVNRDL